MMTSLERVNSSLSTRSPLTRGQPAAVAAEVVEPVKRADINGTRASYRPPLSLPPPLPLPLPR